MKSILFYLIYVIYLFLLISFSIVVIQPTVAVADPIVETPITFKEGDLVPKDWITKTISQYATGTKAYQMARTIYCESNNYNIKSYLSEESYGLIQLHLPSHPDITKEQALNPDFAIHWMADNWSTKWYAYNRLTDKCNLI